MFTQFYARFTQRFYAIEEHYANMFTQALHKFPMLTQLYSADITQINYAIITHIKQFLHK